MFCRSRIYLSLALLAGLGAAPGFGAEFKRMPFSTADGVELEGTFYPSNVAGKKDYIVLLLHNFDQKGGGSHQDGWDHLAAELQNAGYSVFTFDFRGFGNSKNVNAEKFWRFGYNKVGIRGGYGLKPPETIDSKKFSPNYYPYLINDIIAAKAFLDRKNDSGEVNTSNLVIIGAGNGATLGAMWLWSQCRLRCDKASLIPFQVPTLDDPESRDIAGAVWLSLGHPFPGGRGMPLSSALREAGREYKIPMAFVFGDKDNISNNYCRRIVDEITGLGSKKLDLKETGIKGFDTNLVGSKLLDENLPTEKWIIETYLNPFVEKRGVRERRIHQADRYAFYWSNGRANPMHPGILAKKAGDEMPLITNPEGLFSHVGP